MKVIKQSFRQLAHLYHPDKSNKSLYSDSYFLSIKEAFQVLSDSEKRAMYDHERWLSGIYDNHKYSFDPVNILQEIKLLNKHLIKMDHMRVDRRALKNHILRFLSDDYIAVLQTTFSDEERKMYINEIIQASDRVNYRNVIPIVDKLIVLCAEDSTLKMTYALKDRKRKEKIIQQSLPWMVVFISILLCIAMYFWK